VIGSAVVKSAISPELDSVPSEGLIWRNIGRVVQSLKNGSVLFEAGEHGTWDVVTDPATADELCAALSLRARRSRPRRLSACGSRLGG
jgi:hypothetical protein